MSHALIKNILENLNTTYLVAGLILWENGNYSTYRVYLQVIDSDGFRLNVGIIICNRNRQLLWARRVGQDAWQFPQGGVQKGESLESAMYRELAEETGLSPKHVNLVARSSKYLRYRLPSHLIRRRRFPVCIGQKQKWFLLHLTSGEDKVRMDHGDRPEFDGWRWVNYWLPVSEVVSFKRRVYQRALEEFQPYVDGLSDEIENNYNYKKNQ